MIKNGSDLMLFADSESIGGATNCKLNISAETSNTANKDEGGGDWDTSTIKKLSWEVSSENLFLDSAKGNTFDDLFDMMIDKTPIDAAFSLDKASSEQSTYDVPSGGWTLPTTGIYKGKAIITSLEANAPAGDNATFSVTMKGTGKLQRVDA